MLVKLSKIENSRGIITYLIGIIRILERFNYVTRGLNIVGLVILFLWACLTFVDVLLRYLFDRPMPGSIDIGEIAMVVVVFCGVAYTQLHKTHIRVDLMTGRLSPRAAIAVDAAIYILCAAVVAVLMWWGITNTLWFAQVEEASGYLRLPLAPAAGVVAFGLFLLLIVLLQDLLKAIVKCLEFRLPGYVWIFTLGIPLLVIVLLFLWMNTPGLSPPVVGIIGLVCMFIFIFAGVPIGIVLIMLGFVFVGHIAGPTAGLDIASYGLFCNIADYSWTVIALFLLMGYFIVVSKLGADSYSSVYKWIGHHPGGLAIATIGSSAALAAVVGDPLASTVTMGTVALPEMKKYKYSDSLATGAVAAGGTLGPMIPPSIAFIIYGILTSQSIGKLFMAGVIPGILLAVAFAATIYIRCLRNPALGPRGERSDWRARLTSLKTSGPIGFLFLIIIGGIYMGVFSAIEGGAIGAIMALVIALIMGRLTWKKFAFGLREAGKLINAILFMIGGALMFGFLLGVSNLGIMLVDFLTGLPVSPTIIVVIIMLSYLILGFVMDAPLVLLLTVPLLYPVAEPLGIDPIWFGVLLVLMANLGLITPPYGAGLFVLRGVAKDVSITTMYRGVLPFVISTLVVAVLILYFPQLAIWLPNLIKP